MAQKQQGFEVEIGAIIPIPEDAIFESTQSVPQHDGPKLDYCTRLTKVGDGEFVIRKRGGGKVLFLPQGYVPGQSAKVKISWIASNCRSVAAEEFAND